MRVVRRGISVSRGMGSLRVHHPCHRNNTPATPRPPNKDIKPEKELTRKDVKSLRMTQNQDSKAMPEDAYVDR